MNATEPNPANPPPARGPAWLREPLLHFLLLGAALFAIDQVLVGGADGPDTIVVTAETRQDIAKVFQDARGRAPDATEAKALLARWLDNEVLYREGLALQVDRGDKTIRERVIFKALSVIDANQTLPAYDDSTLRTWFEARRDKYDEPARYDFQEAVLVGSGGEDAVRAFVVALNAGTPGDAQAGLRVFKGRPHANLVQSYGAEFAQALESAPVGEWRPYLTGDGWRAIRLEAVSPARPAVFEALRGVVLQDWTDTTMAERRTTAVRAMARKYTVRVEGDTP